MSGLFGMTEMPKMIGTYTLDIASGENVRELGGFPIAEAAGGGLTRTRRFLRSGVTTDLSRRDLRLLWRYGVRYVLDLRGSGEVKTRRDPYAQMHDVTYLNVNLYNFDMHDPQLAIPVDEDTGLRGYLTSGYLDMLANKPAVRQVFEFFAAAAREACVMFHCTAGMDRTGVISMLLLALAGVDRVHIIADYAYSYADEDEVNAWVFGSGGSGSGDKGIFEADADLRDAALNVMADVYDRLCGAYGSVTEYLKACGIGDKELAFVRARLCD